MDAMIFSDHYVAYFDILGYKDFFSSKPDKVVEFVKAIESANQKTSSMLGSIQNSHVGQMINTEEIGYRIFSDNILLYLPVTNFPYEKIRMLTFLTAVANIQKGFVNEFGLFVRGAITKGKFLCAESSIHGKALIDVVEMEKYAEFPRIIVSEDIINTIFTPVFTTIEQQEINGFDEKIKQGIGLSEDESQKQQAYLHRLQMELPLRRWCNVLTFWDYDKKYVLNYLYEADIKEIFPLAFEQLDSLARIFAEVEGIHNLEGLKQKLLQNPVEQVKEPLKIHREKLMEKLMEYGTYANIDTLDKKVIEQRHKIIKKYAWVLLYHNTLCQTYKMQEYAINIPVGLNVFTLEPEFVFPMSDSDEASQDRMKE